MTSPDTHEGLIERLGQSLKNFDHLPDRRQVRLIPSGSSFESTLSLGDLRALLRSLSNEVRG